MSAEENIQASEEGSSSDISQLIRDGPSRPSAVGRPSALPGSDGARFYTIQRVNGNGANGKVDSVMGGHRHTIEESDRIKKNSIYRHFLKEEKEKRKSGVSNPVSCDLAFIRLACPRVKAAGNYITWSHMICVIARRQSPNSINIASSLTIAY